MIRKSEPNLFIYLEEIVASNEKTKTSKFSKSWSQPVSGLASELKFIDGFGVKNQNEIETQKNRRKSSHEFNIRRHISSEDDEIDASDDDAEEKNEFINDEAEEASDEDSMDEEERQYIKENEIVEEGISLGSSDTDEAENIVSDDNDSFVVSDESVDLLDESEDIVSTKDKKKKTSRILKISDSSEDMANTSLTSPKAEENNEKLIAELMKKHGKSLQKPKKDLSLMDNFKLNKSLNDIVMTDKCQSKNEPSTATISGSIVKDADDKSTNQKNEASHASEFSAGSFNKIQIPYFF